ncbi:NINE protein [Paenibacillus aquistagni]|uniref:TM2 domain-containing protein n=1 Tax=Paenibacillus aquistagni TaxID=1852522 RepID=A0A1X7K4D9_9BACL|nr:TM2 domain-containing protein [Paenibacillus aquistagni]NMM54018.1 TM2 domain-containing protein [Paenibacillus aquistagni]SMG35864.1 TM2 domain-containing protein [Paenibacillus aquistagni]
MLSRYDLTTKELMLLQSEMRNLEKSAGVAYLLLIGGHLGAHRFYLKRTWSAIIQLVLFILATIMYVTLCIFIDTGFDAMIILSLVGFLIPALALLIWIIVDLFLISKMVRAYNAEIEQQLLMQIKAYPIS